MMAGGSAAHILMIYIFVSVLDWGFTGVCLATSLQFMVRFLIAIILTSRGKMENIYKVSIFSHETVSNLGY